MHARDEAIKRMTNSKTMNVSEVSEYITCLKSVLRHFQLSGKSTALLNESLEMLDLNHLHMMTFCQTQNVFYTVR